MYDSASTTSQIADKRLRVEMSAIRETKDKGEISVHWIDKENQIVDCLTRGLMHQSTNHFTTWKIVSNKIKNVSPLYLRFIHIFRKKSYKDLKRTHNQ